MANVLVEESVLQNIANAIRAKNNTNNQYYPGEMAQAILALGTDSSEGEGEIDELDPINSDPIGAGDYNNP